VRVRQERKDEEAKENEVRRGWGVRLCRLGAASLARASRCGGGSSARAPRSFAATSAHVAAREG
jgi:hypothetical protein